MNILKFTAISLTVCSALSLITDSFVTDARAEDRPNILWISAEDICPNLGCYDDAYASTPNLDALASAGVRFDRAFTHAGVCAVLRSGLITGVYPVSIGSQHMRSKIVPPPHIKCFPEYLRAQGYYCTNKSKTDYQFDSPESAWDQQGPKHDDWRGREKDQPFFSVINLTICHESKIRKPDHEHAKLLKNLKPEQHHDPDKAGKFLPPYLPNTPASRKDWACYSDNISEMDRQAGEILQKLKDDGLADNTLVLFWGDHGQGMPRGKRWIYDSGTHVPLIMSWPGKLEAGTARDDLVTLLDLPPTMLSVAGAEVPEYLVGRKLIGPEQEMEPSYLFFHRDRMDEIYEMIRGARDRNFKYLRNFEPERTYSQHLEYMDEMPTMKDWRRLNAEGKLNEAQSQWFAERKPVEELFDLRVDPHELNNLADDPKYQKQLATMRKAVEDWQIEVGDTGLIPEPILMQRMRPSGKREKTATPQAKLSRDGDQFVVKIECETEGASIEYAVTRDGDKGPEKYQLYSEPFKLDRDGLKMLAFRANRLGFIKSAGMSTIILKDKDPKAPK